MSGQGNSAGLFVILGLGGGLLILMPILLLTMAGDDADQQAADSDGCLDPASAAGSGETITVSDETVPDTTVAGYGSDQLANAATIIRAGEDLNLSGRDQTIAVMTAAEESTLENIDYGDDIHGVTNPDGSLTTSIGLFQQQDHWGTEDERMDPHASATMFYEDMLELEGRDAMSPTEVAHEVQANAFPDAYADHWDEAVEIVEFLAGEELEFTTASGDMTPAESCDDSGGGSVPEGDIVEASTHLAWEERTELDYSEADEHGREESRDSFVEVADGLPNERHTAYYTDCGVFVASVMRSSGVDETFPARSTSAQSDYLEESDDYETFYPQSEEELEAGDILINSGHVYIYTDDRTGDEAQDGSAQGGSLYTRVPSGHYFYLSDSGGQYMAARHTG